MLLVVKKPHANVGDTRDVGSVRGWGTSPGGGHGNPLQCSCLKNSVTGEPGRLQSIGSQSQTQLKQLSTHACTHPINQSVAMVVKLWDTSESPGMLVKPDRWTPPWSSDSIGLGWNPVIFIFNKLPGEVNVAGNGTHMRNHSAVGDHSYPTFSVHPQPVQSLMTFAWITTHTPSHPSVSGCASALC